MEADIGKNQRFATGSMWKEKESQREWLCFFKVNIIMLYILRWNTSQLLKAVN